MNTASPRDTWDRFYDLADEMGDLEVPHEYLDGSSPEYHVLNLASNLPKPLKSTLILLIWHGLEHGIYASRRDLAEILGVSVSTLHNHTRSLEKEEGWLEVVRGDKPASIKINMDQPWEVMKPDDGALHMFMDQGKGKPVFYGRVRTPTLLRASEKLLDAIVSYRTWFEKNEITDEYGNHRGVRDTDAE